MDRDDRAGTGGGPGTPAQTGWRPDLTARHEGRYYVTGRPTGRVRDGRTQSTDPVGGRLLPDYLELANTASGIRSTWLATGVLTVIVAITASIVWALLVAARRPAPTPDAGYLHALHDDGVSDQFASDSDALTHGRQVCAQLAAGAPRQGQLADKLAVDAFCPQLTPDFRILDTVTASGVFVLTDHSGAGTIDADGRSCRGTGGYTDIDSSTPVTVTSGTGEVLAVTALGVGAGDRVLCTFRFAFPVTEGQERYVVSVGHRGRFPYTFGQLAGQGPRIRLGH